MIIEGVRYHRFVVRYTVLTPKGPKRRRMLRWSPAFTYARDEVAHELVERFGLHGIKRGSVSVRYAS